MKICTTAVSGTLDSPVDPRFGRCQYFMIINSKSKQYEPVSNIAMTSGSGAGIQAAQTMASRGVQVVITGNVGPKAFQALSTAGINIITGVSGTVKEAFMKYLKGDLSHTNTPTVGNHFGMNSSHWSDGGENFWE